MRLPDNFTLQNGKYRIIRFISSGGFGCTYEAEQTRLHKRVAIKEFFIKDFCNRDEFTAQVSVGTHSKRPLVEKLKKKFLDEAEAVAGLTHPGIVSVMDVFEENGTAYFVMEYIDGRSLSDMVRRDGPMSEDRAVRYISQVADALAYVHSRNRLHLDVKPGNIMVDSFDRAILIDFGSSKQYDEESGENTSTLLGYTVGYAPLEQIGNDVKRFSPATDVYSLGATLYKLLTGITPPSAVFLAGGDKLKPLPAGTSSGVRRAVETAMSLNKGSRPDSVAEFMAQVNGKDDVIVDDVTAFTGDDDATTLSEPETELETPSKPQPEPIPSDSVSPPIIKPTKKKPWLIHTLVAAGVIFCIVLGLVVLQKPEVGHETAYSGDDFESAVEYTPSGSYNGYDYVDLGLSVKWATCNVGAYKPYDYGDYFAWGETKEKSDYSEKTSDWYNVSYDNLKARGVIDSRGNLTHEYDVAAVKWGGSWRMPTKEEIQELIDKCTWTWISLDHRPGVKVNGSNGNSIFLPLAGFCDDKGLYNDSFNGSYWTSTAYTDSNKAIYFVFYSASHDWLYGSRYYGMTVRPVIE